MNIVFPPADLHSWVQRIYGPGKRLLLTDYAYPLEFSQIPSGGTQTQQIQIQSNADFILLGVNNSVDSGSLLSDLRYQITDSATGEQIGNQQIPSYALANYDDSVISLCYPRWVGGNTSLSLNVRNVGANPCDLLFTLRGFLVREY